MTTTSSMSTDNILSPPVRDTGLKGPPAIGHRGHHLVALQQHIQQGGALLRRMQLTLCSVDASQDFRLHQVRLS